MEVRTLKLFSTIDTILITIIEKKPWSYHTNQRTSHEH